MTDPHRGISRVRDRLIGVYALLIGFNVAAWVWALAAFHQHPVLLGTALLAYTLGLRHAASVGRVWTAHSMQGVEIEKL